MTEASAVPDGGQPGGPKPPAAEQTSGSPAWRFVSGLERLARPGGRAEREPEIDRAALAALRRGLGKAPGEAPEMLPYLVPLLPPEVGADDEWAYFLVASLFAWHPPPWPSGAARRLSLGQSFAWLRPKTESESAERAMVALLNSDRADLPERLRRAVGLLRSHQVQVDWSRLLQDLLRWDQPTRDVQRRWARDFWGAPTGAAGQETSTTDTGEDARDAVPTESE